MKTETMFCYVPTDEETIENLEWRPMVHPSEVQKLEARIEELERQLLLTKCEYFGPSVRVVPTSTGALAVETLEAGKWEELSTTRGSIFSMVRSIARSSAQEARRRLLEGETP